MKLTLPLILESKLAAFRSRVWFVKLAEAILAAISGVTLSYLAVFILERFSDTPMWLRLAFLGAGTSVFVIGVPLKWYRWVWSQRSLEDAARLLRRTFPRLGDQLLGIVELARHESQSSGRSERLVQAAMEQAAEAVKDKDFTDAVPEDTHQQWTYATAILLALTAAAAILVPEAALNTCIRWINPWSEVPRFTFTKIIPVPNRLIVPFAEPFELPLKLSADTQRTPESGTAQIPPQPLVSSVFESGQYLFRFSPQKLENSIQISLGDLRKSIDLIPKPRPELTEIGVQLRLPDYLGYKEAQHLTIRGGSVNILRGAAVSFVAKASNPLATAQLDDGPQPLEHNEIRTAFLPADSDSVRKLFWTDIDGLSPRDPLILKVHTTEDEPPRISAKRESQEQVVLDSEVVTFDLQSSDDFGIKNVGLAWNGTAPVKGKATPTQGERISAAGNFKTREMATRATFCATRDGVAPQTIEIRAWSDDYLPSRQHTYSAAFTLHILSKTDHALWLIEQFGKWIEAAKEGYDREQQLHQSNLELQNLSSEELDRFETRKRIAQQAADENANAARLSNLSQNGRNLLEQATRNNEFDAQRLESWAGMVKSLTDISATRMPNVANLLKQTANASAQSPTTPSNSPQASPSPTPGAPGTPAPSPAANTANTPSQPAPSQTQPSPNASSQPSPPASPTSPPLAQNNTTQPAPPPTPSAPASPDPQPPSLPLPPNNEPGFLKPNAAPEPPPKDPPKDPPPSPGGLPATMLAAAPSSKPEPSTKEETSPAQQKLDSAIKEQKELLAEFAKVADQLNAILGSLEASTFVKRLKEASRQQIRIANDVTQKTLNSFGITRAVVPEAAPIAKSAKTQSEFVGLIQSDLDAYATRKQDARLKKILEEMKRAEIVTALSRSPEKLLINLSGQTVSGAEFWADTLDRWAEELVAANKSKASKSSSSGNSEGLPPEIVLKVMQALRDEMKLRDETREAENAKPSLEASQYKRDTETLTKKQSAIQQHTEGAIKDIQAIPEADSKFGEELKLLNSVVDVMTEAVTILKTPETGAPAIAAETEAIELLLQTKRNKPNSAGGGAGAASGEGGRAATASSALSELGPGGNKNSAVTARPVGQATGHAGKEYPAEFKSGLDAYFNQLENAAK